MLKTNSTIKISIFFFIFSVGCLFTFILLDIFFYQNSIKNKLMHNALEIAKEKEFSLIESTNTTSRMLHAISKTEHFKLYLSSSYSNKGMLEDMFLMLAQQDKNIMQLRFIDKDGLEITRVDRNMLNTDPFVVEGKNLQNKASRYYFKDSINKPQTVWYSNVDLNIEHGKVEIPYKATLRAMLPIIKNEEFQGVLIINYFMENILNEVLKTPSYNVIIANDKGDILVHFNPKRNWSFYSKNSNITQEMPNFVSNIITHETYKTKDYISKRVEFEFPSKLYFIFTIDNEYINTILKDRVIHYMVVGSVIVVLSFLMSLLFSKQLKKVFVILKDTKSLNRLLSKEVKNKTKELVASRQKLLDIITSINDFIWEIDKDGKYIYVSPQVRFLLGYKPEELLGKTPYELMPATESIRVKKIFDNHLKQEKPILQLVNEYKHKDGSKIYLERNANPIFDENKQLIGYRGSDRDITQKIETQQLILENMQKIEDLNKQLKDKVDSEVQKNLEKDAQLFAQSKMAVMGDMVSNIAHQWRQPLSAISTIASGTKLKQELQLLTELELSDNMDSIVDKTQFLSQTIDTFMNFIRENKEFKKVEIASVVHHSIDIVKSSLDNNFIELTHNIDEFGTLELTTIASEIEQVIINILNNAKDAIKENHINNAQIHLSLHKDDDMFTIMIEDNAGGIPDDVLPRIFEAYFTTKHTSNGTGLGLHMSYRVITESLKGSISATNGKEGAIFTVQLPLDSEV